ncbi:MAG: hypothetical protein OHK003_16130 [Anaerolineales bacterium]
MEFGNPFILVAFFGIFHVIGGLSFGKGIRKKFGEAGAGNQLIAWGLLMGAVPIFFDWFFLIRAGMLLTGVIGPALFIVSAAIGGIFLNGELSRRNEKSIAAVLMGGTALMLSLLLIPYLIQQAQTRENLGLVDYLCGGSIPILFILIGASFMWTGLSAILKRRSFDEHIAERETENEEKSQKKRKRS